MISIAVFVGYNLLNGLKPDSGIDNAAHFGGLLSGFVIGYAYVPGLKVFNNRSIKFSTIGILAFTLLISSYAIYRSLPNDIAEYDQKMNEFVTIEERALAVFRLPENAPDDQILYELKGGGTFFWNKGLKLMESCDNLELPASIVQHNDKMKEYCRLRIRSYELIAKAIEEDTEIYENEIFGINQEIELLIEELTAQQ